MKRNWLHGARVASLIACLGLVGCGGGGIDEGMPKDTSKSDHPIDPSMTPLSGMGAGAAKKAQEGQAKAAKEKPAGEAPAEKK